MSENAKRIVAFVAIAILAAAGLATAINTISPAGESSTVFQTDQIVSLVTTQGSDFNVEGPVPLISITHGSPTFILAYNITTYSNSVVLSFNLSGTYVTVFSNGTEWVSLSQPCNSSTQTSSSASNTARVTSVTSVSGMPCGQPQNSGWAPINGSAIHRYEALTSDEITVSILPTSIVANSFEALRLVVTLNLKPGVYVLGLALGVQIGTLFEISTLSPFPVIVKA